MKRLLTERDVDRFPMGTRIDVTATLDERHRLGEREVVGHRVADSVLAGEIQGGIRPVRRKDLDLGVGAARPQRHDQRDRDGAAARADVGDA